jgi:glycosyltransferase involved in cell wall biosynthesis
MRILVDYRAALRARTGVGHYIRELTHAYTRLFPSDAVVLFSSSWKDRPDVGLAGQLSAHVVDRRIPVKVLNLLWHRAEWPPVEALAGRIDVAHAAHPLLIPARTAAQIVTFHDLFFLTHPELTRAEIRRDYPALAGLHAHRADAVITVTRSMKEQLMDRLRVPSERIHVCPSGPPAWTTLGARPNVPPEGYILFLGTLEPRKNVGALLDAYAHLLERLPDAPRLVLAGRATPDAAPWLARLSCPPLRGHASYLGYVPDEEQERLYAGARMLVLPSLDEGFGLPVLAAMSAGVPVIASRRGSLPEVVGDAGMLVDPEDGRALAAALHRLATDLEWATSRAHAGLDRAKQFSWAASAETLRGAYLDAMARRGRRTSR